MHDAAEPLALSKDMLELFRLCRALRQAGASAEDTKPAKTPTVSLAAVRQIEDELEITLPDDVLGAIACGMPIVECASGVRLEEICDVAEDWADGVPEHHVAVAAVYEEPFAEREEGAHGGEYDLVAVPRRTTASGNKIIVIADGGDEGTETTLGTFIREKISAWYGSRRGEVWLNALRLEPTLPLVDPAWTPRLVGEIAGAPTGPARVVVHPKFGRGVVVSSAKDGSDLKLVIDFGARVGKKTLLERFVRDA